MALRMRRARARRAMPSLLVQTCRFWRKDGELMIRLCLYGLALGLAGCLVLTACPPGAPPAPVPPDATDAAPTPASDASAPMTPCQAACDVLARLCGPQKPDCVTAMAHVDGSKSIRNGATGKPLTCMDVADAGSAAELRAIGETCP